MVRRLPKALKIIAIVHGKSEYRLCENIKSALHLKMGVHGRENGKTSIQVGSILDELKKENFKTERLLKKHYPDVDVTALKVFIIMDLDDCQSEKERQKFIHGSMFANHWLAGKIVPIYSIINLEDTLAKAGVAEIGNKKDYIRLFPTNHGKAAKKEDILALREKLIKARKVSNWYEFVDACLREASQ